MSSRTRTALVAVLAALSLAGSGCSIGSGDAAADSGRSSDRAAKRSAAAEKAHHAYVDPCSLLERDQREAIAGTPIDSSYDVRLFPSGVELNSCSVSVQGSVVDALALNYGYAVTPKLAFRKFLKEAKEIGGAKIEKLDGVGDEAYLINDTTKEAWVRKGDNTLFVWTTNPGFDTRAATKALTDLLAKATPGMLEHPIHLPRLCPAATDPRVVAVLGGRVDRAIGSTTRSGTTCSYATRTRSLSLGASGRSKQSIEKEMKVSEAFSDGIGSDRETLEIVANSTTSFSASEYGPYAFTYMLDPATVIHASVDATVRLGRDYGYPSYDQAAFRRLNDWWVHKQAARLRR
ncbi:hypothetical protein ASG90_20170 [Nocardioides sp. Soil797]|nr:hypothetical protein ASG90_20170 [Nocardioides sp. Soil797]